MQEAFELNAQARSDMGKGASRRLRRTGQVPGIIYGGEKDPELISLAHNELVLHLENEAFYSHILTVKTPSGQQKVVLKDVQRHPAKPFILHVDLLRIKASEKLKMQIPLHFVGEDTAPGVKQGGVVSHNIVDVEVSCLPGDLPEFIEVDVSGMDIGDSLHLSDIVLPSGVELTALQQGPENDATVVGIATARAEVPETEEASEIGAEPEEGSAED
jgi:large subunit ribosomal protein L25